MGCSSSSVVEASENFEEIQSFHDKYVLGAKLGQGAFAQVRSVIGVDEDSQTPDRSTSKAVKIIDIRAKGDFPTSTRKILKATNIEKALWTALGHHENCVHLHEVFFSPSLCYMVMERCSCSLLHHFEHVTELTERTLGQVFAHILRGVAHVHASHVVHRDLKPDNFLIGDDGQTVKIADYGLSDRLPRGRKLHGMYGTAPFMSPEMLADGGYDNKIDIWSIGVTVYVFLFGTFPYMPKEPTSKIMKMAIADGVPPKFEPVGRSAKEANFRTEYAVAFVKALLCRRPEQRPTATEALDMEFTVASVAGRHAHGIQLPSLRSALHSAKKVGAFDMREVRTDEQVDDLLNALQMEKHGVPVPGLAGTPSSKELQESGSNCSTNCPSIDSESGCEGFHKVFWSLDQSSKVMKTRSLDSLEEAAKKAPD